MSNLLKYKLILLIEALIIALLAFLLFKTSLDGMFARDQVSTFQIIEKGCLASIEIRDVADELSFIMHYLPSGSRQRTGTDLDKIVESVRLASITKIIDHLSELIGQEDLNRDPNYLIDTYSSHTNASKSGQEPLRRRISP